MPLSSAVAAMGVVNSTRCQVLVVWAQYYVNSRCHLLCDAQWKMDNYVTFFSRQHCMRSLLSANAKHNVRAVLGLATA